ncbi:MAG: DUF503 domain-containing protein [Phycisphaerae bacterium]
MSTVVGLLHLELHVAQAMSLKDKRRILKSFKDRVKHRFNVSVAEVGGLESHRTGVLAIAAVSNEHAHAEGTLQRIVNMAAMHRDMVLIDQQTEWL